MWLVEWYYSCHHFEHSYSHKNFLHFLPDGLVNVLPPELVNFLPTQLVNFLPGELVSSGGQEDCLVKHVQCVPVDLLQSVPHCNLPSSDSSQTYCPHSPHVHFADLFQPVHLGLFPSSRNSRSFHVQQSGLALPLSVL